MCHGSFQYWDSAYIEGGRETDRGRGRGEAEREGEGGGGRERQRQREKSVFVTGSTAPIMSAFKQFELIRHYVSCISMFLGSAATHPAKDISTSR